MYRLPLLISLLAIGCLLLVPDASGQTATLTGTVTDRQGQTLPGANVVARGEDDRYGTSADSRGRYELTNLPPGSYEVEVSFVGYEPASKSVTLEEGGTRTLNFTLRLSTGQIEEVVVTAQNRSQSLQEVPISATAFTANDLDESRISSVEDYAELTPNLTFSNSGRRSAADITIRGVSNLGGQNNAYGVYVDGLNIVPSSSDIGINPKLVDVKRIEVLRGPQGTHFGRNAIAGAVSITTVKPNPEPHVEVGGKYESFNTFNGHGTVNVPLTENLYVRANGFYEQSDGFLDDIGPGGNTNDREEWGGRVAARYEPTSNLVIDAAITHSEFDQGYETVVPSGDINPSLATLGFTQPILEGQGTWPENQDKISTDSDFSAELTNTRLMGRIEYDLDSFSIISVTGLIDSENSTLGERDNTAQALVTRDVRETLDAFSQEIRVQSDEEGQFDWLVGGNYADDETRFFVESFFGEDFALAPALPETPFQFDDGRTLRVTESIGLFGEVSTTLWDQLDLLVGLRYTNDDVSSQDTSEIFNPVFNPNSPRFPGVRATRSTEGSITFNDLSPRFAATYHLTETANVYATVSRGYKAGGFNENQGGEDATFDDEVLWNYELGVKSDLFNHRLRFDASAFYMDWTDLQVNSVVVTGGQIDFQTQNAAEAESFGVEAQLSAVPVDGLRLGGGVGYLDATFESFPNAVVDDPDLPNDGVDLSGGPLPRSPEWTANAFARYQHDLTDRFRGFVRGQLSYTGDRYEDIAARKEFFVPSYTSVDVSIGVETDRFRVSGFVENATDNEHFVGIRDTGLSLGGLQVSPRPRIFGVEFTATLY